VTIRTRRDIKHSVHVIETQEEWFRLQDSFLADAREVPLISVEVESHFTPRGAPGRSDRSFISPADSTVLDYYDKPAEYRPSSPPSFVDMRGHSHAPAPNVARHHDALFRLPLVVIEPNYPPSVPTPYLNPFWEGPSSSDRESSVRSLSREGPSRESFSMDHLVLP
jgi:hypothetical protein